MTKQEISKINDLLFFDDLALHYVVNHSPVELLVNAFSMIDDRLFSSLLRNMEPEQRKNVLMKIQSGKIHKNIDTEKNQQKISPEFISKKKEIEEAFIVLANDLKKRALVQKKGCHFYGKRKI